MSKRNPRYVAYLGYIYGKAGRTNEARSVIEELKRRSQQNLFVSPMAFALVYAGLEDADPTLNSLDEAFRQRAFELVEARDLSAFEFLYSNARFQELMRKVGLPIGTS